MKNNYLKHLILCLCLLAGTTTAFAYDAYIDGIYYYLWGNEAMVTYKNSNYNSYSGAVTIPSSITYGGTTYSVTSIGNYAFYNCSSLTSITIPESVTSIGYESFSYSSSLTYITIPESVTYIGARAFYACSSMTSITIPESVTYVGDDAFSGTAWYESQPDGVIYIGKIAYKYKGAMQEGVQISIALREGTSAISGGAFEDCKNLISIAIPNSVTSIGSSAFRNCTCLTSVTIGSYAFYNCSSLTSVTIGSGVTSIGSKAFQGCSSLTSVTIGNSVTSIGDDAFADCSGLTSVSIPNSVTSIGDNAFRGCSRLTSITIPNSVTSIGRNAFYKCSGLTSVTIGNSVTSIGGSAFSDCKLRNVLVKCVTPPNFSISSTFSSQTYQHAMLYVPAGTWDDYAFSDYYWYNFNNIRETAMAEEEVSPQQAYTLMDAKTFAYSVYDPVNDCIGTINSAGSINEDNPNHSWQMIEAGGMHFLYNLGAKKYVKRDTDGLSLSDEPEPIDVADGDNGIILAGQTSKQWALVSNESLSVSQAAIDDVTGIRTLSDSPLKGEDIYNLAGQRLNAPQKGLNIIGGRKVHINGK